MSLSKWMPGSHIGFFGIWTLTLVWLWISSPNINSQLLVYMARSLLIFSNVTFKMATGWPYWIFQFPDSNFRLGFEYQVQTSVAHYTLFVYMQRSLLIFRDVTFKMAARWPCLIFQFPGALLYVGFEHQVFSSKLLVYMERILLIFSNVTFKEAAWHPYWIFGFWTLTLVWLWTSDPNFRSTLPCVWVDNSLVILNDVQLQSTHCPLLLSLLGGGDNPSRSLIYNF